jgi:hypothetical protein
MPKEIKVPDTEHPENYCLFCGNRLKTGYDEYTPYSYCDCADVKHNEHIAKQIAQLKAQLKRPRFSVQKRIVLVKREPDESDCFIPIQN